MSNNGLLSVKSAYNFIEASNTSPNHLPKVSSSTVMEKFWKVIWRLELPKKIKLFIWRAYNNGIPVGTGMMRKLGLTEAKCCFCNYKFESAIHLFKDYWWFRTLWISLDLNECHLNYQFLNYAD